MSQQEEASLQRAYEIFCEVRDVTAQSLNSRLSTAGFDDVPDDGLLILAAVRYGVAARVLRRLGVTGLAASQSLQTLILREYLEFRDNPGDPHKPTVALTKRGDAALDEAMRGVYAHRWAEFPFLSGDIVISTAPKSGTTWMQMICALLIFQTPRLPAALPELSPWLDAPRVCAEIYAKLAGQQHRRFIKSHMPLNEIPIDQQVTYIVVARNPLDVAVSWYNQIPVSPTANIPAGKSDGKRTLESSRQWVLDRIDEIGTHMQGRNSFETLLKNLTYAWERRAEPNVVLVHYEDLSADLAGEMRQLARHLDITVPEAKWPALVQAATFKEMQATAKNLQPQDQDVSKGYSPFFRRGSSGEGRSLLTNAEITRYYARAGQVAPRDLLAWLHRDNEQLCDPGAKRSASRRYTVDHTMSMRANSMSLTGHSLHAEVIWRFPE
jgi:hypothetical protein